jgi:hypothetical protein
MQTTNIQESGSMSDWIWTGILIFGAMGLMLAVMWITEEGFTILEKKVKTISSKLSYS